MSNAGMEWPTARECGAITDDAGRPSQDAACAASPGASAIDALASVAAYCLVFLKLFERVYAPLTAGLLQPVSADTRLQSHRLSQLDKLYRRVVEALDRLLQAVGLKAA